MGQRVEKTQVFVSQILCAISKTNKREEKTKKNIQNSPFRSSFAQEEELQLEVIPSDVFVDLEKLFNDPDSCCDVIFKLEGTKLYCHKIVICLRSSYFRKMFTRMSLEEVTLSGIDEISANIILHFCYRYSWLQSN